MARAVFQYFNLFSMMYTGKPLVTSKGAVQRRRDPRQLLIHGNLAQAQMAQTAEDEAQEVVPSSWELVSRGGNGETGVLARNVLAFDLASDGAALYSDGAAISRIGPDGRSERLLQAELVERVLAL